MQHAAYEFVQRLISTAKRFRALGLAIAAIVSLVLILNHWRGWLIDPYRWDKPIREQMKKQGFELVAEVKSIEATIPYVTRMTFAHPGSIKPYNNRFFAADVIAFARDNSGKVESWPSIVLFDCASNTVATIADQQGSYEKRIFRLDGDPATNWWFGMNEEMTSYLCNRPRKHR
jgi:hypothetical protein